MIQPTTSTHAARQIERWQWLTVGLLVLGYAGYYLCRSNLSTTMPSITEELVASGMARGEVNDRLGWAVSLGTIGYALGKFAAGPLTDRLGGRRTYLIGMIGAVVCTMLITLGASVPVFTLIWFSNRLVQSLGWPGMIKITSRWFSYSTYGRVMGVISLSFLFGDAAARAFMGRLIRAGLGWREVFWVAGGVLAIMLVVSAVLVRESPRDLGLPEPETNPDNLFGALGDDPHPAAAGPLLATLRAARPSGSSACYRWASLSCASRSTTGLQPTWSRASV